MQNTQTHNQISGLWAGFWFSNTGETDTFTLF